ncbi:MAG: DUF2288 domain-containing protein [Cellvibrionaceae bacterium]
MTLANFGSCLNRFSHAPQPSSRANRNLSKTAPGNPWKALAPHYDSGGLVVVDSSLDLVRVAYSFAKDDKATVENWLTEGQVTRVESKQVSEWNKKTPEFWAVVVAPWVLIQMVTAPGVRNQPDASI